MGDSASKESREATEEDTLKTTWISVFLACIHTCIHTHTQRREGRREREKDLSPEGNLDYQNGGDFNMHDRTPKIAISKSILWNILFCF